MGDVRSCEALHGCLDLGVTAEHQMGAADDGVNAFFTGNCDGMVDNVDQTGVGTTKYQNQSLVGPQKQGQIILQGITSLLSLIDLDQQSGVAGFVAADPGNAS